MTAYGRIMDRDIKIVPSDNFSYVITHAEHVYTCDNLEALFALLRDLVTYRGKVPKTTCEWEEGGES